MRNFIRPFINDSSYFGLSFFVRKYLILTLLDLFLILCSFFLAYFTRFLNLEFLSLGLIKVLILYILICFSVIIYFKLYDYPTIEQDQNIFFKINLIIILIFLSTSYIFFEKSAVPRSIPFILNSYLVVFLILSREVLKKIIKKTDEINNLKPVAIIGTGDDAVFLKNMITSSGNQKLRFFFTNSIIPIKDQRKKYIDKIPIIFNYLHFLKSVKKYNIKQIYFTEKVEKKLFKKIKIFCEENEIKHDTAFYINNNLADHIFNLNTKSFFDEIFEKKMHGVDLSKQNSIFKGKNILITGGVGTIGNAIYEQIKNLDVNKIHLLDNSEIGIFNLKDTYKSIPNTVYHLGSINDEVFLNNIFEKNEIDIVFHAAAFKHVSLVQSNILSSINNNIFGTEKILKNILKYNIKTFIMISSDKAVEPLNLMGLTKRYCELLVKEYGKLSKDNQKILSVRFGNVAGSSGSVIPIFLKNLKNNEDLIVKGKDSNRFFMSSTEAAYLVTLSTNIQIKNGDVLFFDMGDSFNIHDIAKKMKNLFPYSKSKIVIKSLENEEKISEKLVYDNEEILSTKENKIYIARDKNFNYQNKFKENFDNFKSDFLSKKLNEDELVFKINKCIN